MTEKEKFDEYMFEDVKDIPVVSREEWGARPPTETKKLRTPISHVIFTYCTDTKEKVFGGCKTPDQCIKLIKEIQDYYLDVKHLRDIPYNFMVGGDGRVYEGRGWNVKPRKSNKWHNIYGRSMEIAYLGDHHEKRPPKKMWNTAWDFCEYGQKIKLIDDDYEFFENYDEKRLEDIQASKPWYDHSVQY